MRTAGEVHVHNTIGASRLVLEIVGAMKEVSLRNKESEVADVVAQTRTLSARARGNMYFLGQLPRYALESGLIVGFVVIGGVGFLLRRNRTGDRGRRAVRSRGIPDGAVGDPCSVGARPDGLDLRVSSARPGELAEEH